MKKPVLYAEDDPNETFVEILEEDGNCEITTAKTAAEAIDLLYKRQFKALILDIIIPAGEGYEQFFHLTEATRGCPGFEIVKLVRDGCFGKIPVIIFSGLVGSFNFKWRINRLLNDHIFAVSRPDLDDELIKILSDIK